MCFVVVYTLRNDHISCLRPLTEQEAYAFPIVGSSDTFGDGGADVDDDYLGALLLTFSLWDGVGDLRAVIRLTKEHQFRSGEVHTTSRSRGRSWISPIIVSEKSPVPN
jgi:hypothetical protein